MFFRTFLNLPINSGNTNAPNRLSLSKTCMVTVRPGSLARVQPRPLGSSVQVPRLLSPISFKTCLATRRYSSVLSIVPLFNSVSSHSPVYPPHMLVSPMAFAQWVHVGANIVERNSSSDSFAIVRASACASILWVTVLLQSHYLICSRVIDICTP